MDNNLIIVTDWEKVSSDDYYISNDWGKSSGDNVKEARKLQKEDGLYYAYIVDAKDYAIYHQMDSDCVLVDHDCSVIVRAESSVINNTHEHVESYDL